MADTSLDDFLKRNREMADLSLEQLRRLSESDKHWTARRSFLARNLSYYPRERMDYLVTLSMVWANHIFMGCRYSEQLMEKVLEMADGVNVEDAPTFTTRDEIINKQKW
ncbi:CDKN2AIP N-terminal-like protein [Scyliorhinus canicula]|uniref:CDKN2AIP N-terminal-like protein n=1 Tax=Scyliorhinus canicula TaxID=7830 RepID=UPI0018F74219|nr:CDKN2AIP N-terminal-like protein [Scyliorhinus canicula]